MNRLTVSVSCWDNVDSKWYVKNAEIDLSGPAGSPERGNDDLMLGSIRVINEEGTPILSAYYPICHHRVDQNQVKND